MHSVVSVSVYFAYISNVEEYIYICRWIKRYIIALWINICFIMAHTINEYTNLLSNIYIFHLTSSNFTWKKNPKRRISHTPVNLPGQMKQQAGLPKVKRRIRRAPVWQMKSNQCKLVSTSDQLLKWTYICNKKNLDFMTKVRFISSLILCILFLKK